MLIWTIITFANNHQTQGLYKEAEVILQVHSRQSKTSKC